jgi:hypothetical protein
VCRYALNVWFNLLNKSIFKYFPFPYTVSTVHVVVGTAYCLLVYIMGLKKWSFSRVRAAELYKYESKHDHAASMSLLYVHKHATQADITAAAFALSARGPLGLGQSAKVRPCYVCLRQSSSPCLCDFVKPDNDAPASLSRMFLDPQPVTKQEFGTIFGPAFMHAIGHIAANISFAAVAISLTHTVKTLEPAFNVVLSRCGAAMRAQGQRQTPV